MNALSIGVTALRVGQRALELTGQNISNANTPGYSRQTASIISKTAGPNSAGVDIAMISRASAPSLRSAIQRSNSEQGDASVRLATRQQIETSLGTGSGSIGGKLEEFFNQVERLSTVPQDTASRRAVVSTASDLAQQFRFTSGAIDELRSEIGRQISADVADINATTTKIADLNNRIAVSQARNEPVNELRDQRSQLIDSLSKKVDIRAVEQENGNINIIGSTAALVVGDFATKLEVTSDTSGNLLVSDSSTSSALKFNSGELSGRLREFNTDIPATRARLDALATKVITAVNEVQTTGIGAGGPVQSLTGTRPIADPAAPLVSQTIPLGVQAGQVIISVTEIATGTQTNFTISVDPNVDSLNSVASAITSGTSGQVQAAVNPTSNVLQLVAPSGYRFDIAGRVPSTSPQQYVDPDTTGLTVALGLNGVFTGTQASDIGVNAALVANPGLLAASRTGRSGDSSNIERFAALRDQPYFGSRTLTQEIGDITSSVGEQVQTLGDVQASQQSINTSLTAQEQSIVGIDLNEEMVNLLNYQRMIESASQYMSVVNSALDSIMSIVN